MIHARDDYNRIQDPAGKIPADEPVFLLRAQDALACQAVGWKLVPIEPTQEMIDAGCEVAAREIALADNRKRFETAAVPLHSDFSTAGQELQIRYRAMLASAPTPEPMSAPTAEPVKAAPTGKDSLTVERDEREKWLSVAEHGLPDAGEEVLAGFWYTDPWLKPEKAERFMFGTCRIFAKKKSHDFPDGKVWQTFGPSHNQITHWKRVTPPGRTSKGSK